MLNVDTEDNCDEESFSRREAVELILEPLSSLVDDTRLEILKKIQDVEDLIEILARQVRQEMND